MVVLVNCAARCFPSRGTWKPRNAARAADESCMDESCTAPQRRPHMQRITLFSGAKARVLTLCLTLDTLLCRPRGRVPCRPDWPDLGMPGVAGDLRGGIGFHRGRDRPDRDARARCDMGKRGGGGLGSVLHHGHRGRRQGGCFLSLSSPSSFSIVSPTPHFLSSLFIPHRVACVPPLDVPPADWCTFGGVASELAACTCVVL